MNNEPVAWMRSDWSRVSLYEGDLCTIPLYTHPAKELHLSLQKSKETGELLAVTYTDDEHRIVEVLWQKPPAKTLTDDEIISIVNETLESWNTREAMLKFARSLLRRAQEK